MRLTETTWLGNHLSSKHNKQAQRETVQGCHMKVLSTYLEKPNNIIKQQGLTRDFI